jgi:hypothetical protein
LPRRSQPFAFSADVKRQKRRSTLLCNERQSKPSASALVFGNVAVPHKRDRGDLDHKYAYVIPAEAGIQISPSDDKRLRLAIDPQLFNE